MNKFFRHLNDFTGKQRCKVKFPKPLEKGEISTSDIIRDIIHEVKNEEIECMSVFDCKKMPPENNTLELKKKLEDKKSSLLLKQQEKDLVTSQIEKFQKREESLDESISRLEAQIREIENKLEGLEENEAIDTSKQRFRIFETNKFSRKT